MIKKSILAVIVLSISCMAQNFTGKWKLNLEKTQIPGFPEVILEIKQNTSEIEYTTKTPLSSGEIITTKRVMPLNGTKVEYEDHRGKKLSCSAVITDSKLVVNFQSEQKRRGEMVVLDVREEGTLSDDKSTLSVVHFEGTEGKMGRYPNPFIFEAGSNKNDIEKISKTPVVKKYNKKLVSDEFGEIPAEIDSLMRLIPEVGGVPSMSAAIVVNGKIVWARNFNGVAGLKTAYGIGSISKTFTATAILQLYEKGKIDLDKDVSDYLPFKVRNPEYPGIPITVKMLLSHQSGIIKDNLNYFKFAEFSDPELVEWSKKIDFTLPHFEPNPVKAEFYEELMTPGGKYYSEDVWAEKPGTISYSNIGYGLLTLIVERVAGVSFEDYVGKNIFEPLEMKNSGFNKEKMKGIIAPPAEYVNGDSFLFMGRIVQNPPGMKELVKDNIIFFPVNNVPSGPVGIKTSVEDLAKFQSAHMNGGRAQNGYQLLKKETIELMHSPWTKSYGQINQYPLEGQGLGWAVCKNNISGHIGGQLGYMSVMLQKETEKGKVGYIVLMNYTRRLDTNPREAMKFWENYVFVFEEKILNCAVGYLTK